ncbi:MarR family winged helix-turn-helix transcriptional regulator [Phenylobacterium montanum]|uniref:MarR family transcriptional regulator n=1 Tax=Phenylobacterium montanum TaxID=2823693 RepID=A0A975G0Q6_9CAUL|nr:MarR family transcriptional regulator [Caulobacter sp. S6]QUD88347.1 MarR family transcriptional regulator [Caulobacter sp. S6]
MTDQPDHFADLAAFRFALRQFVAASEQINREAGTTQQQYQAMLAIKAWPGEAMSMKDLADQLLLTHHAAVQLVDRLAKAGLAVRQPSLEDRRSVRLTLTPEGDRLFAELAEKHLEAMLRQEPSLSRSLERLRRLKI